MNVLYKFKDYNVEVFVYSLNLFLSNDLYNVFILFLIF